MDKGIGLGGIMKKDASRKWMWWFLIALAAVQIYFVRELLAVFALFSLGFAALAFVVFSVYLMQKGWETVLARTEQHAAPALDIARRGLAFVGVASRKRLSGPDSEPVQ